MGEGPRRRFPAHPRPHPAFTERGVSLLQRVQGEGKGRCLLWSQDRAVALSGSTLHARCSTLETESHRVGVGREDLSPPTPNPPRTRGIWLPLCLQLTVQLTMSSPGAPPPPLRPEGATEGAVRAKGHRQSLLMGSEGRRALRLNLGQGHASNGPGYMPMTWAS